MPTSLQLHLWAQWNALWIPVLLCPPCIYIREFIVVANSLCLENPNWWQTTVASLLPHSLWHTVPHVPLLHNSTRPLRVVPPASFNVPSLACMHTPIRGFDVVEWQHDIVKRWTRKLGNQMWLESLAIFFAKTECWIRGKWLTIVFLVLYGIKIMQSLSNSCSLLVSQVGPVQPGWQVQELGHTHSPWTHAGLHTAASPEVFSNSIVNYFILHCYFASFVKAWSMKKLVILTRASAPISRETWTAIIFQTTSVSDL